MVGAEGGCMKIAFLVLNHRGSDQLVRLLTTLRSQLPESPIVVHHDIFHGDLPVETLEPIGDVHLLTSGKRMAWGDFSLVDVYCWSLRWMAEHLEFDWVILLSAQDYPIKPLSGLADELQKNNADAVMYARKIRELPLAAARRDMVRRYFFQYRAAAPRRRNSWLPDGLRGFLRRRTGLLIDGINFVQPLFKIYRLPDGMPYRFGWRARHLPFDRENPCWYGSMWFGLSRRALEYAMTYMDEHPEFVAHYSKTIIPDESMLATVILNAPHLRVEIDSLHYTRWSGPGSSHPDTFRVGDLAELASASRFFARKFDLAQDTQILDELDKLIAAPVPG